MKTIAGGWCAALSVTCAASAEDLNEGVFYYQIGLGGFAIADDTVDVGRGFEVNNDVKPGLAFRAVLGRRLDDYFSVETDLGLYSSGWEGFEDRSLIFVCDDDDNDCLDPSINTLTLTLNGVVSAPTDFALRPYIGAGAGLVHTSFTLDDEDSQVGFGYLVKIGADVPVAERYRAGIEYTYVGAPDVDLDGDLATFSVSGGAVMVTLTGLL